MSSRPPTDTNINTNLSLWLDTLVKNPKFWAYTGIGLAVVLGIILLIVIVLRKRIVIAIALVKEGSKYAHNTHIHYLCLFTFHFLMFTEMFPNFRAVSSIYSTVFFPILPWILQIAVTLFAIIVGLYLASIGQPVNQVLRLSEDTNCQCTGPASILKVSIWSSNRLCKVLKAFLKKIHLNGFIEKLFKSFVAFNVRSNRKN